MAVAVTRTTSPEADAGPAPCRRGVHQGDGSAITGGLPGDDLRPPGRSGAPRTSPGRTPTRTRRAGPTAAGAPRRRRTRRQSPAHRLPVGLPRSSPPFLVPVLRSWLIPLHRLSFGPGPIGIMMRACRDLGPPRSFLERLRATGRYSMPNFVCSRPTLLLSRFPRDHIASQVLSIKTIDDATGAHSCRSVTDGSIDGRPNAPRIGPDPAGLRLTTRG